MRTRTIRYRKTGHGTINVPRSLLFCLTLAFCALQLPRCCEAGNFDKSSAGTSACQFLKVAAGARGVAMGEAYSAMADDAGAMDWNPAGIIKIKGRSISVMHSPYLVDTFVDFFSYGQNAGEVGSWGMAVKYMNYGTIKKMDSAGVERGKFTPYDISVNVGFATYITGFNKDPEERFVLGATGKLVRSQLLNADNAVSADIGVLFPYLFDNRFQLAMSAQNIMGSMRYDQQEFPLPLILRLGSVTRLNDNVAITADMVAYNDNIPFLAMGGEVKVGLGAKAGLFLRSGFNTRAVTDFTGFRNLTFGTGFTYSAYSIDYSFSPFGIIGSVHRISASMNF